MSPQEPPEWYKERLAEIRRKAPARRKEIADWEKEHGKPYVFTLPV